jgi:hypothetical protein
MKLKVPQEYPTRIARVGSVLALVGSLIWVQWPVDFSRFNPAAVILCVAAVITWASVELADYQTGAKFDDNVASDDVTKFNSILNIIDKNQYYILRQKSIQTYMGEDDYEGIRRLIYYKENDIFPFHNENIQPLYEKFCADAKSYFMDFYNLYTNDGRGRSTWRAPGEGYVSEEIFQQVAKKIAVLDNRASKLADLWEKLVDVARQELKGASKAIERYDLS